MIANNPYELADADAFWRTGVANKLGSVNYGIYKKKFQITPELKIATAGSCFAQHIGKRLAAAGFNLLDYEQPSRFLPDDKKAQYNYGVYSARYGNIYTVRQLLQLVKEAFGLFEPQDIVWKNNKTGKFVDALRPAIDQIGFDTFEEVLLSRAHHIKRVRELFKDMGMLIFTLGLTEAWVHNESGTVYPIVPGSIAGVFDSHKYSFVNFSFNEIKSDLIELINIIDSNSWRKKYLFTISPVPLTATASGDHVMVATFHSKSVLRSVVGELYKDNHLIEYFPSYEIVVNPWSLTKKFENNQRSVLTSAVDEVMDIFLSQHVDNHQIKNSNIFFDNPSLNLSNSQESVVCEEMFLDLLNKESL